MEQKNRLGIYLAKNSATAVLLAAIEQHLEHLQMEHDWRSVDCVAQAVASRLRPHVIVASIQSTINRLDQGEGDWLEEVGGVIIDEAHHAITKSYTKLLNWLPDGLETPVIGLTATPVRGTSDEETERLIKRFHSNLLPESDNGTTSLNALIEVGILSHYAPKSFSECIPLV